MNPDDRPRMLLPDRVEWVPSSPEAIEVRVFGTWHGPTVPRPAVLVVGEVRSEQLAAPPGGDVPPAWSAAFLVPVEERPAIEAGEGVLLVGPEVVGLPEAEPGRMDEPGTSMGTVVDPAVMAERRARRAEISEQSASERAATAEEAASTLRAQLEHLEERLARAAGERDSLAARVADAERRLRLAEQREEAERRRRGELEEELAAQRRSVEEELRELSDRLASAVEVAEALERELVTVRGREEAERAAREHVDEQLRAALSRVSDLEGASGDDAEELRRQAAILAGRLEEAEAERARLEAEVETAQSDGRPSEELHAEVAELRRRLDETLAGLEREREAHAATEHARQLAVQRTQEERAAREAAERDGGGDAAERERALAEQIAALEREIAARAETHQRVQAAIDTVRNELGRVRAHVLESRGSEVEALTDRVRLLEDVVRQRDAELEATRAALADAERTADELRARPSADSLRADFEARIRELSGAVAEMRQRLRDTTSDFERRLAEERTRREAAEAALAALTSERAAPREELPELPESDSDGDDALEALIAGLREQVESAREELRAWDAPEPPAEPRAATSADDDTRERLRAIEADVRATVPDADASIPAREVIASLQDAADRLRAAAEQELSRIEEEAQPGPPEPTAASEPRVEDTAADASPSGQAQVEDAATPEDAEQGDGLAPASARAVPLGPRAVDFGAGESPWLKRALERLSASDPTRAADLLVALLPSQAMLGTDLSYILTAPTLGAVRVVLSSGSAQIERPPSSSLADARISGSLAGLAPLVAGGGSWRAKGVRIEGSKRPARKLLRRRRPVALADFALITPAPGPGMVLRALAAAVDPQWTTGHRFGVAYEIDAERWTITADDGAPLRLTEGDDAHAATVAVPGEGLAALLQGAANPATVAGDRRAVDVLHAWFDRARGVAAI